MPVNNYPYSSHIDGNQNPSIVGVEGTLGTADTGGTARTMPIGVYSKTGSMYTYMAHASVDTQHDIKQAINQIYADYGDIVSVEVKAKQLLKFGENPAVGSATTGYTIWYTGQDQAHETYVAANTNSIDSISSGNAGDTMAITIEGHTESGGNKTFIVQSGTLNGQTRVALGTPLNRINRMYVSSGTTSNAGEIYGYENTNLTAGKPTDTTKIHITLPALRNQTYKASTALSSVDYWIVTNFYGGYKTKTGSNFADIEIQFRPNGSVFRPISDLVVSTGGEATRSFDPYIIIPKNSDIRLVATASAATQYITGGIQGYLAKIVT